MTRRMDYSVRLRRTAGKDLSKFHQPRVLANLMDERRERHRHRQTGRAADLILHNIKYLFDDEEAFTADWISKHH